MPDPACSRRPPSPAPPLLALLALLIACGAPLPEERQSYAGQWDGAYTSLRISPEGFVAYERQGNAGQVQINGPIRRFEGDGFNVGLPLLNTTFEVQRRPWFQDGRWHMVVDGAELVRSAEVRPAAVDVDSPAVQILEVGVFGPQRRDGSRAIVDPGTRIPAALGRSFGATFAYHDPRQRSRVLTFRWDFPPVRDPRSGAVTEHLVVHSAVAPRGVHWVSADLNDPEDLVAGRWTLSILDGEHLIERRAFQVHVP